MKQYLAAGAALFLVASTAHAQPTLTMETGNPGGGPDIAAKNLAQVAAAENIATIQVQVGKSLTGSIQQVAEGKTDIAATGMILNFLMSKGLGPYVALGKEKGAELAGNLRMLYPYHLGSFYLVTFESSGIDGWDKLEGKTVFNGPPRGGALTVARTAIKLTTGLEEGSGYSGKQVAWGQANSLMLDGSVDAQVRPGTNPAEWMPLFMAAGKVNLISIPKAKFEGEAWQKFLKAPGNVDASIPVTDLDYGDQANIISEDGMFRTVANAGGDVVHKEMDDALAKALTAAFIKSIPELNKKVAFAKSLNFGSIEDRKMGLCGAGVKLHPGAIQAWQEAGYEVEDCMKPASS